MAKLDQTFKSSALLIILSSSNKLVGLLSTIILARFLTPEDYGIVTIATLTFGLLEVMSKTGSAQYVITSSDANDNLINTAFTYNAILKTGIALIFLAITPLVTKYYQDPRLLPILVIFSFMLAFTGFQNPQVFLLKKHQKYGAIVKMTVTAKIISAVFAVIVAITTKSYWALVVGQFIAYTLPIIGGYIIAPYKPTFTFSNIKNQFSFSVWLVPSSILGYFRTQIDTILVSKIFDNSVLGSYHVMKYLAFIPTQFLIAPMTQPLLAQLSSIKENKNYFSKMFNISMITAISVSIPISQLLYTHATLIIEIVLGSQWVSYSDFLSLFGVMIVFTAIYNQSTNYFLINGKTRSIFIIELLSSLIISGFLLMISFTEPYDFAIAKVGLEISLTLFVLLYIHIRFFKTSASIKFITIVLVVFLINLASRTIASWCFHQPQNIFSLFGWLSVYFFTYAFSTTAIVYLFKSSAIELEYLWLQLKKLPNIIIRN